MNLCSTAVQLSGIDHNEMCRQTEDVPFWQRNKRPRNTENDGFIGVAPRNVWFYLHNIFSTSKLARPIWSGINWYIGFHVFSRGGISPTTNAIKIQKRRTHVFTKNVWHKYVVFFITPKTFRKMRHQYDLSMKCNAFVFKWMLSVMFDVRMKQQ